MAREPSGEEVDKRMSDCIIRLRDRGREEESIKLEKAQKYWRTLRELYFMSN